LRRSQKGSLLHRQKDKDDEGDPTKQYWKQSQSVWFDGIVVARQYIGPMVKKHSSN